MNARPYDSADLFAVMEIYTDAIRTLAAPYYSPEQLAAWAPIPADIHRWRERLSRLHTIVVESEGTVAGFASYTHEGYLDFLFTHPAFARRGVASCLYGRVESSLRTLGVQKISAHASLAARDFFDRQGFQVEREEQAECRGVILRRFAMYKPLLVQ